MIELSNIGIFTVFIAGLISFVSPCVLPLVPAYVSFIAGRSVSVGSSMATSVSRLSVLGLSASFVLGFSTIFILLGASATVLGRVLLGYRYELNIVGGAIVILFGLFMLGMARNSVMQREFRFQLSIPGGKPISAYVLGLAFGFGWTPCIGPILGTILTASAATATVQEGVALLAIYSIGLGVPFLLAAAFTDRLAERIRSIGSIGRRLHQVAGLVMIVMGGLMMTGQLSAISYRMLEMFPALGLIG